MSLFPVVNDSNVDTVAQVNPYLLELDKKKPKALAHEWGAGYPCSVCKDNCPGLELHYWRKICKNCGCSKDDHDVPADSHDPGKYRIGRLFLPYLAQKCVTYSSSDIETTESESKNASNHQQSEGADLPRLTISNALMNELNKMGEKKPLGMVITSDSNERRRALSRQIPLQDIEEAACLRLDEEEKQQMEEYLEHVRQNVIGEGQFVRFDGVNGDIPNCKRCDVAFNIGDVMVATSRISPDANWHPKCFTCDKCEECLADLIYFVGRDAIYCGRHYVETLFPRCGACDELIFAKQYTFAESLPWHIEHFCCLICDKKLGNLRYVFQGGQPHCLQCYEKYFAKTCTACGLKIGADIDRLSHNGSYWHNNAECFKCKQCHVSLVDKHFIHKSGSIYCSIQCRRKDNIG